MRRRLRESFRAFCPECRTCRVLLELGFPVAYGSFGVIGRLAEWEGGDVEGNGRRGEQMMPMGSRAGNGEDGKTSLGLLYLNLVYSFSGSHGGHARETGSEYQITFTAFPVRTDWHSL